MPTATVILKTPKSSMEELNQKIYLQQLADVADTDTLKLLAELVQRPGACDKFKSNATMIKLMM